MPAAETAQSGMIFSTPDAARPFVEAWHKVLHLGAGLDDSRLVAEFGRLSGLAADHVAPESTASLEAYADVRVVGQTTARTVRVLEPSWEHVFDQFSDALHRETGRPLQDERIEIVALRLRRYGR